MFATYTYAVPGFARKRYPLFPVAHDVGGFGNVDRILIG